MLNWIEQEDSLGSDVLTVRAQAQNVENMDELLHPVFFPYDDVDSVKIKNLVELDNRLVAERREWNQRGRRIPIETPDLEEIEMIPIEAYFKIGEREQQALREQALNNEQVFRQQIRASIPERVDTMPPAIFRRVEMDAMEAWAKGQITVRHAYKEDASGNALTLTISLGYGSRIQTAGTAWDDGAVNAYDELISFLEDAETEIGPLEGVVLRRATLKAILEDAPNPMPGAQSALTPTRTQVEERIADELGTSFSFFVIENAFDVFDGAGSATTRTKVWPAGYVSAVPQGQQVGSTLRAPVARAMELANQVPEAGIDIRGTTVYYDSENGGRTLSVECQANHLPLPNEQLVYSIDTLVT